MSEGYITSAQHFDKVLRTEVLGIMIGDIMLGVLALCFFILICCTICAISKVMIKKNEKRTTQPS